MCIRDRPKDLDASEIEVRLGATWIDKEYIQQFMYETFNTPFYLQRSKMCIRDRSHPLQPDADEREVVPAPSGDRRDRPEQTGADDAPAGERCV